MEATRRKVYEHLLCTEARRVNQRKGACPGDRHDMLLRVEFVDERQPDLRRV